MTQDPNVLVAVDVGTTKVCTIVARRVDDDRFRFEAGEAPEVRSVRFRTLGCYPLTGAIESTAATTTEITAEMAAATRSEREGRVIDHDRSGAMEEKKREGYF